MYKMCLSLSEKMIKSGRELKADSPSPMCAGNGVFFFWPSPGMVRVQGRVRVRIRVRLRARLQEDSPSGLIYPAVG